MESKSPLISVVIPAYNAGILLHDAVESVLAQTFSDFELIILDDGSSDDTWEICQKLTDPRIQVLHHENIGVAATMNRGISLARGKYFARLDHDDLMLPKKLEIQHSFLEKWDDVAMIGTWADIHTIDNIPTGRSHRHVTSCDSIRFFMLFDNPFVQSSMMIRTDILKEIGGYCEDKSREPDDYELLSRVARHYIVANLPEVLTIYRETANSLSRSAENPLLPKVVRLSAENLYMVLKPNYNYEDCTSLACLYHGMANTSPSLFKTFRMMRLAIGRVAGQKKHNSTEFESETRRFQRYMISKARYQTFPPFVIAVARWIKKNLLLGKKDT